MQIDLIENFETLNQVRNNWNFVYDLDPQAQFFLSWIWVSGNLKIVKDKWLILAAKTSIDASGYVAFFPLRITVQQQDEGYLYNEIRMAGNDDYTGLICLPEYEEEVIHAFAAYLKHELKWAILNLENILETDTRMYLLLRSFSQNIREFSYQKIQNQPQDGIDISVCPYVTLADDWEQYLQKTLGSNTRQKIRRLLRKIEGNEFHITHVNAENIERHLEILLNFWQARWGSQKGSACEAIMKNYRSNLRHCFENQCLYFPVLWKGDTPIGAIANLIDVSKKSILFFVGARDRTVKEPPPGLVLHAYGIQYAIQNGFKVYDFLMGNEAYKFSFGAKERHIKDIIVERKNWISQDKKLDVRTLPRALQLTNMHHRANRLAEAEQGYRQILEVQPLHPDALYGLGVLMKQKGEYQAAENLLRSLLQTQPNSARVWLSLGNLHQAQGHLSAAVEAYLQSLALQPNSPTTYNNLGYTLQQQCKWEDAIACYQKALELQPDCMEADVNLANALHAQEKLSLEKPAPGRGGE